MSRPQIGRDDLQAVLSAHRDREFVVIDETLRPRDQPALVVALGE